MFCFVACHAAHLYTDGIEWQTLGFHTPNRNLGVGVKPILREMLFFVP